MAEARTTRTSRKPAEVKRAVGLLFEEGKSKSEIGWVLNIDGRQPFSPFHCSL